VAKPITTPQPSRIGGNETRICQQLSRSHMLSNFDAFIWVHQAGYDPQKTAGTGVN
jgi:SBP domain